VGSVSSTSSFFKLRAWNSSLCLPPNLEEIGSDRHSQRLFLSLLFVVFTINMHASVCIIYNWKRKYFINILVCNQRAHIYNTYNIYLKVFEKNCYFFLLKTKKLYKEIQQQLQQKNRFFLLFQKSFYLIVFSFSLLCAFKIKINKNNESSKKKSRIIIIISVHTIFVYVIYEPNMFAEERERKKEGLEGFR
jgi:hypothetical protein